MPADGDAQARPVPVRTNHKPPTSVDISGDDKVAKWKAHKLRWEQYSKISGLNAEGVDPETKKAEFLYSLGTDTMMVYQNLDCKPADTIEDIIKLIDGYVLGETHLAMEHFKFNKCVQGPKQSFDDWLREIRERVKTCHFNDIENVENTMIRNKIIFDIHDKDAQRKMLEERDADLKRVIDIARSCESASQHLKTMRGTSEEVSKVYASSKKQSQGKRSYSSRPEKHTTSSDIPLKCKFCKKKHPMKKELCPAWGHSCNACHKKNHFKGSEVCGKTKKIHAVDYESDGYDTTDEEVISMVKTAPSIHEKAVYCEMLVEDTPVKLQIDCGATANMIPNSLVPSPIALKPTDKTLKMWNNTTITPLGECVLKVKNPATRKKYNVLFIVVEENLTPLISRSAAEKMQLITINYEQFVNVNAVTQDTDAEVQQILAEYSDVFEETVGCFPGTVHLTLKPDAQPVVCGLRKPSISTKGQLIDTLKEMCEQGIIERHLMKNRNGSVS